MQSAREETFLAGRRAPPRTARGPRRWPKLVAEGAFTEEEGEKALELARLLPARQCGKSCYGGKEMSNPAKSKARPRGKEKRGARSN